MFSHIIQYTYEIDPKDMKNTNLMDRIDTVETSQIRLNYHNECIDFNTKRTLILENSNKINETLKEKAEYIMCGRALTVGPSKCLNISFGGLIGEFKIDNNVKLIPKSSQYILYVI